VVEDVFDLGAVAPRGDERDLVLAKELRHQPTGEPARAVQDHRSLLAQSCSPPRGMGPAARNRRGWPKACPPGWAADLAPTVHGRGFFLQATCALVRVRQRA